MKTSLYLQYGVIAVLMVASVVHMFRRLAPRVAVRWQAAAARALMKARYPHAIRALGHWLEPRAATPDGGNCDSGCSACCGCGGGAPMADRANTANESVLQFHPRRKEEHCCP